MVMNSSLKYIVFGILGSWNNPHTGTLACMVTAVPTSALDEDSKFKPELPPGGGRNQYHH